MQLVPLLPADTVVSAKNGGFPSILAETTVSAGSTSCHHGEMDVARQVGSGMPNGLNAG